MFTFQLNVNQTETVLMIRLVSVKTVSIHVYHILVEEEPNVLLKIITQNVNAHEEHKEIHSFLVLLVYVTTMRTVRIMKPVTD